MSVKCQSSKVPSNGDHDCIGTLFLCTWVVTACPVNAWLIVKTDKHLNKYKFSDLCGGFSTKKNKKKLFARLGSMYTWDQCKLHFFFMPGVIGNKNCFFNKLLRCSNKSFWTPQHLSTSNWSYALKPSLSSKWSTFGLWKVLPLQLIDRL